MSMDQLPCPSCRGDGCGPRGVYSPRAPVCEDCAGEGVVLRCEWCGLNEIECDCEENQESEG